jgi:hypothetical protein
MLFEERSDETQLAKPLLSAQRRDTTSEGERHCELAAKCPSRATLLSAQRETARPSAMRASRNVRGRK